MKVTMKAVRVYGSVAYRNMTSEDQLPLREMSLGDCQLGSTGEMGRLALYLGSPPTWVLRASRIRQAIGYFSLNWFRGIPIPADRDTAITEMVAKFEIERPWQDTFYATLVVEQDIEVPETSITENQFVWFFDQPHERAHSFLQQASPYLDELAVLASAAISSDAFQKIVIRDHVYFAADGRETFGLPESSASVRLQVSKSLATLNMVAIQARISENLALEPSSLTWLKVVTPWWLAGIREEYPWMAFMQHFTGLELMHKKLLKRYYGEIINSSYVQSADPTRSKLPDLLASLWCQKPAGVWRICSRSKLSARGNFAILALALFPDQANSDFAIFDELSEFRNAIVHGDLTLYNAAFPDRTAFPVEKIRMLLARYIEAALAEHVRPHAHYNEQSTRGE